MVIAQQSVHLQSTDEDLLHVVNGRVACVVPRDLAAFLQRGVYDLNQHILQDLMTYDEPCTKGGICECDTQYLTPDVVPVSRVMISLRCYTTIILTDILIGPSFLSTSSVLVVL